MSQVAPLKKSEPEPRAVGLGDKYQALIFKQRSVCFSDAALVAVGKTVTVEAYAQGKVTSIVRASPHHFRVTIETGQSFIVGEDSVQASLEVRPPSGPVAA